MYEDIKLILDKEQVRQDTTIELIASENYASQVVMDLCGSIFTNKYAEGYPRKRYYNGCEYMDEIEQLAIDLVCELYSCEYANVQPHSGVNANTAVYQAFMKPGDTIMGMDLEVVVTYHTVHLLLLVVSFIMQSLMVLMIMVYLITIKLKALQNLICLS